jgi:hypothetical protein
VIGNELLLNFNRGATQWCSGRRRRPQVALVELDGVNEHGGHEDHREAVTEIQSRGEAVVYWAMSRRQSSTS